MLVLGISSRRGLSRLLDQARPLSSSQGLRARDPRPFPELPQATAFALAAPTEEFESTKKAHLELEAACRAGGGQRGIDRHVKKNKKILVRERIARIIDDDYPFLEVGLTAGMGMPYGDVPCAGLVLGIGRVQGVSCMIGSSDGTIKGGTVFPITLTKIMRGLELAKYLRIPMLHLADSGGAFLPLQSEIFPDKKHGGRQFRNQAVMSSRGIPQISLVNGMCTAGGAYLPTMCDETIIVKGIGTIYLGGPPLVKAATGEVVTAEELGGARMHCETSGYTDHFAEDEEESFRILRDVVVSLNLPDESLGDPDPDGFDEPSAPAGQMDHVAGLGRIGKEEVYAVIAGLVDGSRFREFKQRFGGNLVCGYAFLKGRLVGMVANCGPITAADAQKGAHFMELCDSRDAPVVFLQNSSNGSDGSDCDAITLKERAKFVQHQSVVTVPKVTVNIGGCHGDELLTMCGPSCMPKFNFSWPLATMSKTDPVVLRAVAEAAEKKDGKKRHHVEPGSAQFWASHMANDGVLLPQDTRDMLDRCLRLAMLNHVPNRGVRASGKIVARM